ncbi:hypothetical protein JCM11491_006954 [Sporobolomyces phaffii]
MVGLFAPPRRPDDSAREALKQSLFVRLKAVTVPLLDASRSLVSSTSTATVLQLLGHLEDIFETLPADCITPSLANYAFFPFTSLLQPRPDGVSRGDRVLESTMHTLNALVKRWRQAGMEDRVRRELWTMTVLTLGGPLSGPGDAGKGKEVDRTEESKLAMVEVLETLMRPSPHVEGEEGPTPFNDGAHVPTLEATPSRSILFHTLTTLLALAVDPTALVQLQLSSISALHTLTTTYLAAKETTTALGPSPLLATGLPGMASTLSRIALSKPPSSKTAIEPSIRKQSSSVVVAAMNLLSQLVDLSMSDKVTTGLREEDGETCHTVTLEHLADKLSLSTSPTGDAQSDIPEISSSESSAGPPTGPTIPTPAWLRFTVSSMSTLLAALSPLASHHSPLVRTALVKLLAGVVRECPATFGPSLEGPLEGLLVLSGDDWEVVSAPARDAVRSSMDTRRPNPTSMTTQDLLGRIVRRRLLSLPNVLRKRDEDSIRRVAGIVQTAFTLLPLDVSLDDLFSSVSKWSWNLLGSFELERVPTGGRVDGGGMALAWINDGTHRSHDSTATDPFPRFRLRNVHDDSTLRSLGALWESFGVGAAKVDREEDLVEHFLGVALGPRRDEAAATNALSILEGVLVGLAKLELTKKRKKLVKGLARAVVGLMESLEEEEADQSTESNGRQGDDPTLVSTALAEVEEVPTIQHNKGVTLIPSLAEYKPVVARATTIHDRASHRVLLLSLSLRILSAASSLLQSAFRPLLLASLYHVLSCCSSTAHPFLRSHARTTLGNIASSTSFSSAEELVLANVDYVVNSVSQRMSVTRLDPSAPLVLVEMIRLVGQPIVSIVQDLVDDVFEALDDYHGYEDVTVGLWAVLDALLKVMEEDVPTREDAQPTAPGRSEFDSFKAWFARRKEKQTRGDLEEEVEVNPQKPFAAEKKEQVGEPSEFPDSDVTKLPPTRPQVVTTQILSKSLYFLSHPSPFLRGRVLSLLASAVPLLAQPGPDSSNRSADLLPVIHRAWPFILNRFSDADLTVVVEAARLVEALASHVGDFMSRRILDDVWPRFRTLLERQELEDSTSALGGSTRYSNSHRLYRSILKTLLDVARHVPLKEDVVWDQALVLRRFLPTAVDRELRDSALELYRTLAKFNRDSVWLVLAGTTRDLEGMPEFLRLDGIEFGRNVADLLNEL